MDILKQPIVTKAARALVCLFSFIAVIALIAVLASLAGISSKVESMSIYDFGGGMSLDIVRSADVVLDGAALVRTMAIKSFILSIGILVLAYLTKENFMLSAIGAGISLVQFVMGLILSPICSLTGVVKMVSGGSTGKYLVAIMIIALIFSILLVACNVFAFIFKNFKFPVISNPQQPNMMGQPMYQQPVPQPTQAQQYQQPVQPQQYQQPAPQQMQQPYPQPVPQPQQAQQPYPQPVPQPTQQQPYQQGVPQPTQPQQYQQPNDFNHQ